MKPEGIKPLSFDERVTIERLKKLGMSNRFVAMELGRSRYCIDKEVRWFSGKEYNAEEAQKLSEERHEKKVEKLKRPEYRVLKELIVQAIKEGWSLDQIAGKYFKNLKSKARIYIREYNLSDDKAYVRTFDERITDLEQMILSLSMQMDIILDSINKEK